MRGMSFILLINFTGITEQGFLSGEIILGKFISGLSHGENSGTGQRSQRLAGNII